VKCNTLSLPLLRYLDELGITLNDFINTAPEYGGVYHPSRAYLEFPLPDELS